MPPTGRRTGPKSGERGHRPAGGPATGKRTSPRRGHASAGANRGLGSLLRAPGGFIGQLSGIDGPARSLESLSITAERAMDFLERLEDDVGNERLALLLDHLDDLFAGRGALYPALQRTVARMEDIHRSLREIEEVVVDMHERVAAPLDRVRLTRGRGRRPASG